MTAVSDHEAFQIRIPDEVARSGKTNGSTEIAVTITNNLPLVGGHDCDDEKKLIPEAYISFQL